MEIRVVDPADDAAVRRFWEVGKAADEVGRPWTPYWLAAPATPTWTTT